MTSRSSFVSVLVLACFGVAACSAEAGAPESPGPSDGVNDDGAVGKPPQNAESTPAPVPSSPPPGPVSKTCKGGEVKAARESGLFSESIEVWGRERTYELVVPTDYDPARAYPLVFVFHGSGGTGEVVRQAFDFGAIAGDKAVFVYPNARDESWDLDSEADENEDIAFFESMVTKLESSLCLDDARVFATGYSNGGYFSNQLACRRGDRLRAIASHGGGGPYGEDHDYDENGNLKCSGRPPAAMIVHGEDDPIVSLNDGKASLAHWKWANGCAGQSTSVAPTPCVAFDSCEEPVVWCKIPDLGHWIWSEGAKATWDFFASF